MPRGFYHSPGPSGSHSGRSLNLNPVEGNIEEGGQRPRDLQLDFLWRRSRINSVLAHEIYSKEGVQPILSICLKGPNIA